MVLDNACKENFCSATATDIFYACDAQIHINIEISPLKIGLVIELIVPGDVMNYTMLCIMYRL